MNNIESIFRWVKQPGQRLLSDFAAAQSIELLFNMDIARVYLKKNSVSIVIEEILQEWLSHLRLFLDASTCSACPKWQEQMLLSGGFFQAEAKEGLISVLLWDIDARQSVELEGSVEDWRRVLQTGERFLYDEAVRLCPPGTKIMGP